MKLAVVQHATSCGVDEMVALLERTKEALECGADFICLPERPVKRLSEADSDRFGVGLARAAEAASATIIGSSIRQGSYPRGTDYVPVLGPGGNVITSLAVGPAGRTQAAKLETARTTLGEVAVLAGLDCFAPLAEPGQARSVMHGLVMQTSASSALESEAIRELALSRSESEVPLVVVASLWGAIDGTELFGGSAIMFQGEVLAEAGDGAEIIFAEIDPSEFLDLELLRRPVRIPELLKQKLERL